MWYSQIVNHLSLAWQQLILFTNVDYKALRRSLIHIIVFWFLNMNECLECGQSHVNVKGTHFRMLGI